MQRQRVVVVGAGVIGLSTALHLLEDVLAAEALGVRFAGVGKESTGGAVRSNLGRNDHVIPVTLAESTRKSRGG